MDAPTLRRTGVDKLSEAEIEALNQWVSDLALDIYKRASPGRSRDALAGVVISAANDETFIIETSSGRDVFKARTYCFGISDGDEVVFAKSPGVCTSNTFVTKSGEACEVWCE